MRIAVIGSGPSGIAAATSLCETGHFVDIFDAGFPRPSSCHELGLSILSDFENASTLSSKNLKALQPDISGSKQNKTAFRRKRILGSLFPFDEIEKFLPIEGADFPRAIALGGLSNVWGAACYTMSENQFFNWPISEQDMVPYYQKAADFFGLDQFDDALSQCYPVYGVRSKTPRRNSGSVVESLLQHWHNKEQALSSDGIVAGRSRLAVNFDQNKFGCTNCGLCFSGCPTDAIFHSDQLLASLLKNPKCRQIDGVFVNRFVNQSDGRLSLEVYNRRLKEVQLTDQYDNIFLAAGPLSSFRIAAQSLAIDDAETEVFDNDMLVFPAYSHKSADRKFSPHKFALSEAAVNIAVDSCPANNVHTQFYAFQPYFMGNLGSFLFDQATWKSKLPSLLLSRFLLGFMYLPGRNSRSAKFKVKPKPEQNHWSVEVSALANPPSQASFSSALQKMKKSKQFSVTPIPYFAQSTSFGFSGHLAGTLPMKSRPRSLETGIDGSLGGDPRILVVDSSVFPDLPAQNPTLTIVANALRVAKMLKTS
jgi:choline dehydrogenase-like flavoprotein